MQMKRCRWSKYYRCTHTHTSCIGWARNHVPYKLYTPPLIHVLGGGETVARLPNTTVKILLLGRGRGMKQYSQYIMCSQLYAWSSGWPARTLLLTPLPLYLCEQVLENKGRLLKVTCDGKGIWFIFSFKGGDYGNVRYCVSTVFFMIDWPKEVRVHLYVRQIYVYVSLTYECVCRVCVCACKQAEYCKYVNIFSSFDHVFLWWRTLNHIQCLLDQAHVCSNRHMYRV